MRSYWLYGKVRADFLARLDFGAGALFQQERGTGWLGETVVRRCTLHRTAPPWASRSSTRHKESICHLQARKLWHLSPLPIDSLDRPWLEGVSSPGHVVPKFSQLVQVRSNVQNSENTQNYQRVVTSSRRTGYALGAAELCGKTSPLRRQKVHPDIAQPCMQETHKGDASDGYD